MHDGFDLDLGCGPGPGASTGRSINIQRPERFGRRFDHGPDDAGAGFDDDLGGADAASELAGGRDADGAACDAHGMDVPLDEDVARRDGEVRDDLRLRVDDDRFGREQRGAPMSLRDLDGHEAEVPGALGARGRLGVPGDGEGCGASVTDDIPGLRDNGARGAAITHQEPGWSEETGHKTGRSGVCRTRPGMGGSFIGRAAQVVWCSI